MSEFVAGPVRVSVPATSANLGPGFDALGLALSLRDELTAEVIPAGLEIEVAGEGAATLARDETHLVVRAMRAAFEEMGVAPSGVRLQCVNRVPHGMGMGSSSAALVGGLALARALVVEGTSRFSDHRLFQLAAHLEGHPDNVAPAIFGGFVICGEEAGAFYAVSSPVADGLTPVVFVPAEPLNTKVARRLLPKRVPHADAAANSARAALLTTALGLRPEVLLWATRDFLHQEYRRAAMPDSLALIDALRSDAIPATVSGAGPSVLAWAGAPRPASYGAAVGAADLADRCPQGWVVHVLEVDSRGVVEVPVA